MSLTSAKFLLQKCRDRGNSDIFSVQKTRIFLVRKIGNIAVPSCGHGAKVNDRYRLQPQQQQ